VDAGCCGHSWLLWTLVAVNNGRCGRWLLLTLVAVDAGRWERWSFVVDAGCCQRWLLWTLVAVNAGRCERWSLCGRWLLWTLVALTAGRDVGELLLPLHHSPKVNLRRLGTAWRISSVMNNMYANGKCHQDSKNPPNYFRLLRLCVTTDEVHKSSRS
jgi:hypothetical protein